MLATLVNLAATWALAAAPPLDLSDRPVAGPTPNYGSPGVTLGDGTIESFFRRSLGGHVSIFAMRSQDNGRTWSSPAVLTHLSIERWGGPMPLVDRDGELHFVLSKARGEGRKPNVDRFIDLYHLRSAGGRAQWTEPRRIYEGYCGALQGVFQLASGRILVPFADWRPGVPTAPPAGPSVTICLYSDDGGASWHRSRAKLTAPCHEGYNGSNYGACEPTVIELAGGRLWMLIRTQDGFLYESFSTDAGASWSEAQRSRFHSSNSPAFPLRLPDGRIVLFWNNCQMPPRVGKDGVYGGRDALHAAVSADEGRTWRGFREVYRDPTRNASPPKDGDRGTAYPHATATRDGKILLVSGQGAERRRRFLVDPDWLLDKSQAESFANLDGWHVFKGFGSARRFWRDRTAGARLIPHPDKPGAQVLQVRRPDERDADGAVSNFPAGARGRLFLRLRIENGFGGAQISLTDRMFDPCDDQGERLAPFALEIGPGVDLKPGRWHDLQIAWHDHRCRVSLDGQPWKTLEPRFSAPNGLSYLRLRSLAAGADPEGLLVESVSVEVE